MHQVVALLPSSKAAYCTGTIHIYTHYRRFVVADGCMCVLVWCAWYDMMLWCILYAFDGRKGRSREMLVLCCTTLYAVLCCDVLCYTVLCWSVLCCVVLHYTVLLRVLYCQSTRRLWHLFCDSRTLFNTAFSPPPRVAHMVDVPSNMLFHADMLCRPFSRPTHDAFFFLSS